MDSCLAISTKLDPRSPIVCMVDIGHVGDHLGYYYGRPVYFTAAEVTGYTYPETKPESRLKMASNGVALQYCSKCLEEILAEPKQGVTVYSGNLLCLDHLRRYEHMTRLPADY